MNHPLAAELTYDLAAEYALEGIRLIGAPLSLVNKVSDPPIKLQYNKALLPEDVVEIKQIRYMVDKDDDDNYKIPMTLATDSFHNRNNCKSVSNNESTYVVEEGIIKTSFTDGYVEISYRGLPVDDDGFPLIPDNQKVALAIEYYILFRYFGPLYDVGKITKQAWDRIETAKCWYIPSANSDIKIQSYDHVEAIMNSINRIIINTNAHSNFFKMAGKKERLRRFN